MLPPLALASWQPAGDSTTRRKGWIWQRAGSQQDAQGVVRAEGVNLHPGRCIVVYLLGGVFYGRSCSLAYSFVRTQSSYRRRLLVGTGE